MRRLLLIALAALASAAAAQAALLGLTGDPSRLQQQTGQVSQLHQAFLGWEQGQTWGSPFATLFASFGPTPLVHLGTSAKPPAKGDAITPLQIAQGKGDSYFTALSHAIFAYGQLIYIRPMAEMNHYESLYAGFRQDGSAKGPQYAPSAYRKAFCRIYLILHGGTAAQINAALAAAGEPPISQDLPVNPTSKLRVIWNPLAAGAPRIPANAAIEYYPGDAWLDLVGNDMFDSEGEFSAAENEALHAFAKAHHKPYSLPEWGLNGIDDPKFVQYICDFIRANPDVELAAYYASIATSAYDLADKPKSRALYRQCITPLASTAPPTGQATGIVNVNGKPFTHGVIPFGAKVNVTKGSLVLKSGVGTFTVSGGGVFSQFVVARGSEPTHTTAAVPVKIQPLIVLRLSGGNYRICKSALRTTAAAAAAKPPPKVVRRLFAKGKGHFQTRGNFSSSTVRGTSWVTIDRCDGTLTQVKQGTVDVFDFRLKKHVSVKAGKSYLAKKKV
jgi:hypothetical protein